MLGIPLYVSGRACEFIDCKVWLTFSDAAVWTVPIMTRFLSASYKCWVC
jgi:hypothetical protein